MGTTLYTNRPSGLGGPLSMRRDGVSHFFAPDFQGNTRQLTDNTQTVTDTLTTDAWGVQKAATGSTVNPYKAFGQYGYFTDTPSRQYVRARHLRVDQGRWVSKDPIGFERGDWNLYRYVENNPDNRIDATGLQGSTIGIVICIRGLVGGYPNLPQCLILQIPVDLQSCEDTCHMCFKQGQENCSGKYEECKRINPSDPVLVKYCERERDACIAAKIAAYKNCINICTQIFP